MHAPAGRWIAALFVCATLAGDAALAPAQSTRLGPRVALDDTSHAARRPNVGAPASDSANSSRARAWPISFRHTPANAAQGAAASSAEQPLALAPPKERSANGRQRPEAPSANRSLTTILSSLALVLGLFCLVVWCTRRALPQRATALPKEVVEVLGRAPLQGRQQMQLVRLGNKLVLLGVSANGAETLTEVTDIDEVQRLTALCLASQSHSVTATFRQILSQLGSEPAPRGFTGDVRRSDAEFAVSSGRRQSRPSEVEDA